MRRREAPIGRYRRAVTGNTLPFGARRPWPGFVPRNGLFESSSTRALWSICHLYRRFKSCGNRATRRFVPARAGTPSWPCMTKSWR